MKILLKTSLVLLLLIGIGVSCNETMLENETALEKANLTDTEINNLVKDYNKSLFEKFGVNTPSIQKGKVYNGFLESNTLEEAEGLFLAFLLTEIDKNGNETKITRFDFGLDNKIDFPNEIKNANVIFIGNQLIINDIDKNTWINLFVQNDDETKNITPSIETINGRYLGIEKYQI